jgi:hypothetical protein
MTKSKNWLMAAAGALILAASPAWADIPVPGGRGSNGPVPREVPPPSDVPIVIKVSSDVDQATLRVPARLMKQAASRRRLSFSPTHTVIAGIALSLAVGSVILVRSRIKRAGKAVVLTAVAALAVGSSALAWANVAPPPFVDRPPAENPQENTLAIEEWPIPEGVELTGRVVIVTVDDSDTITLLIPARSSGDGAPPTSNQADGGGIRIQPSGSPRTGNP